MARKVALRRLKREIRQEAQNLYLTQRRLSMACYRHITENYVEKKKWFKHMECVQKVLRAIRNKDEVIHRVSVFKQMMKVAKDHIPTYTPPQDMEISVPHPKRGDGMKIVIIQCFTREPRTDRLYGTGWAFYPELGICLRKITSDCISLTGASS